MKNNRIYPDAAGATALGTWMRKAAIAAVAALAAIQTARADGNNWMASLPDNVYITQLSIPGAHDAASSGVGSVYAYYAKTQTKDINGLWDAGVRAFDLRPKTSGTDGPIYHGSASTGVTLRQALGYLRDKLAANPKEFAIVIMRNEGDSGQEGEEQTGTWHNVIAPILTDFDAVTVAWNPNLRLSDVRGKILILARDKVYGTKAATVYGIDNWGDNIHKSTTLLNDDGAFHLIVQDYYGNVNTTTKTNDIKALLDESMTIHCPNRMYINHASGYTGSGVTTNIGGCATVTNPYICDYLDSHQNVGPTGIIMMDFAGDNGSNYRGADLVNKIIANNDALTANFSGLVGEYYLQNVETGQWIQGYQAIAGADRNRWNTSANMGSYGRPFKPQDYAADGWTLNTLAGDEKLNCEYAGDGMLSLDYGYAGGPTRWKITGPKEKAYITVNHDRWLSVGDDNLLRNNNTTKNAWRLWTHDERIAAMSRATEANPQDVTWLIVNPELMNNDKRTSQWTVSRSGGGDGWQDGFHPNRIFETWNYTSMDFYQTLTVPNGKYEVQAYALFSPTEGGGTNINDYNDYVANGDATVNAYLYANNEQVKLPSIYSFTSPEPKADYAAKALVDGGVSIVDGWWQAARAMGEDGKFHSQPLSVIVTNGQLRLGIKETNNSSPFQSHWIIIGSFSLKYLGEVKDLVTPLRNQLSSLIDEAEAFKGNTTGVLQTALNTALTNARNDLQSNDVELLTARVNALRAAIDNAKAADDTLLEQTIKIASQEGVDVEAAQNVTVNGLSADEVNNALEALRMARKQAHFEQDNATYKGHTPFEGKFYLYNIGRKNYLTSGSNWGTHLALGWPGLELTATAKGDGYTFQFQELIHADSRNQMMTADYADGATGNAVTYVFEAIAGKPGVYALRNGDSYLSFDPEATPDDTKYYNSVTSFIPSKDSEDAQWIIVTKADRLAQLDNATPANPVDATVLIKDASFNKFCTLAADGNDVWNDMLQSWWYGERIHGDKNTQTQTTNGYDLSQTITVPKAGKYRLKAQSYYRDGDINAYIASVQNHSTLVDAPNLYAQIGGTDVATQPIKYLHVEANKAPGEGTITDIGNIPDGGAGLYQASKFFENGLYWNEVEFTVDADNTDVKIGIKKPAEDREGNWVVTDNFRLEYLGVDATIDEDVTYTPVAMSNAVVRVKRTILADTWNTLVLPFSLTAGQTKAAFGAAVQVAEYSEASADASNVTIYFNTKETPSIEANVPVLLKTGTAGTSYTFSGVAIETGEAKKAGTNFDFVGNYAGSITVPNDCYFLSADKLYKSAGKTTIKGTRAYIKAKTAGARIVTMVIDGEGETTGISDIKNGSHSSGATYNLNGQRVTHPAKGVFITNGKRVVIK